MDELVTALNLLARAKLHREWRAARDAVMAAWPEVALELGALRGELAARQSTETNAADSQFDAVCKLAAAEDSIRQLTLERDLAVSNFNAAIDKLREITWNHVAQDAWVHRAKQVTEAAKAFRLSPMSDTARRALIQATLALEAS